MGQVFFYAVHSGSFLMHSESGGTKYPVSMISPNTRISSIHKLHNQLVHYYVSLYNNFRWPILTSNEWDFIVHSKH